MTDEPTLLLLGEPQLRTFGAEGRVAVETLAGSTSSTVLAMLALDPGRVVTLDRLLASVWPEASDLESGRAKVHVQISRLRGRLTGSELTIANRHGGYVLVGDPRSVDLNRFGALASSARTAASNDDWAGVLSVTSDAEKLWRGEPFLGMHAPELELERSHLWERRRGLLQLRCRALLETEAPEEALIVATELRALDSYGEFPIWATMTALMALGRRADALTTFDQYRQSLADDLGLDPGKQLHELQGAVLRDENKSVSTPRRDAHARAVAGEGPGEHHLLSVAVTERLVGRDEELSRIRGMVSGVLEGQPCALLMEGESGIGRTALVRYAAEQGDRAGVRVVRARGLSAVPAAYMSVWRHVGLRLGLSEEALATLDESPTSVTMAGLVDGVLAAARHQPTLLIFDDLHRVDDASVQALQSLVSETWDEPLAVVATREFHGIPSTAAKEEAWTRLSQEPFAAMLPLRPLNAADVAALAGVAEPEAERLLRRTGGNPQLLRELLAAGPGPEVDELPCGIVSIVRSRFVSVPPLTQSLVVAGAAAGARFDPDEVAASLGLERGVVSAALQPAMAVGLIRPLRDHRRWAFRHEVEREGVLELASGWIPYMRTATTTR